MNDSLEKLFCSSYASIMKTGARSSRTPSFYDTLTACAGCLFRLPFTSLHIEDAILTYH